MADENLVDRLASFQRLGHIPREELEWIVDHGDVISGEAGEIWLAKGQPAEWLHIVLSGRLVVTVDRGSGPRVVTDWGPGDVTGMLPYSRMKGPPGDNFLAEDSEAFRMHKSHFREMACRCPEFTALTVHSMLDRARRFRASDLQDEKLASLGKLAAGLAHELNNPASATVRGAKQIAADIAEAEEAARALGAAHLPETVIQILEDVRRACLTARSGGVLSPLEQADREDGMTDWLLDHGLDPAYAEAIATTAVSLDELDALAAGVPGDSLALAVRWIAAGCATRSLASDIEQAATRISDLVAAVKRFTFMDQTSATGPVDVEMGLRDTLRIIASKARAKGASIDVDIEPDLPSVRGVGGELNQVWLNLIDNALDAVGEAGRVVVAARPERDRVVVTFEDNGPGIPDHVISNIFDPFFTTKPPGVGTGLGLDITRRVIQEHRGDVTVDSRPGRTVFRVSLPADRG